jgi:hypothetical protein
MIPATNPDQGRFLTLNRFTDANPPHAIAIWSSVRVGLAGPFF